MTVKIVRKGYDELWKDGVKISQHSDPDKAIERATEEGPGVYRVKRAEKEVTVEGAITEPPPPPPPPPGS